MEKELEPNNQSEKWLISFSDNMVIIYMLCQYNFVLSKLPLETKNRQNHENRRLGLIEFLHMQHCSLRGCIRP